MWFDSRSSSSLAAWRGDASSDLRRPDAPGRPSFSRLMMWFLEGLAECGEALYPSFFELGEYMHVRDGEPKTPYARGVDRSLEEASGPGIVEVAPAAPPRIAIPPRPSRARRLWSALRRSYRSRRTRLTLEALPDDTLHDIGVARCEIDRVVTHENFY